MTTKTAKKKKPISKLSKLKLQLISERAVNQDYLARFDNLRKEFAKVNAECSELRAKLAAKSTFFEENCERLDQELTKAKAVARDFYEQIEAKQKTITEMAAAGLAENLRLAEYENSSWLKIAWKRLNQTLSSH